MKNSQYRINEKKDWQGRWITAPDAMLQGLETFPICHIHNAKWIWPVPYVRTHLRKDFSLKKTVKNLTAEFFCDNSFDVYINGKYIDFANGIADITDIAFCGSNHIGIRLYQTSDPNHFTSAIRGGLRIEYEDGVIDYLPTDDSWRAFIVCDFGQGQEPENWATAAHPGKEWRGKQWDIVCTEVHPRLCRRSCYFRKKITVAENTEKAILRCTARGLYELYINGQRVSDAHFQPGSMEKYCEYQEYDVTGLLSPGKNVIAAVLGNGWLNCESWGSLWANKPSFLEELELTDSCGCTAFLGTDASWKCTASTITDNDLQFGERVDARLEITRWNEVDCDDALWAFAAEYPNASGGKQIVLQDYPPVKLQNVVTPISCCSYGDGWLFDLGKNISGRAQIHIRNAHPGQQINIRYAERLNWDGSLCEGPYTDVFFEQDNMPGGKASCAMRNQDVYICKGGAAEVYTPLFTYTGGRYILVTGFRDKPECNDVQFRTYWNDLGVNGKIRTSNEVINLIWDMTRRTYHSNLMTAPTDCPTREKNFWNGDMQVFVQAACWYMDHSKFLARWTDGGRKIEYGVYGWEDEEYIIPWTLYQFYGDREILRVKYPVIKCLVMKRMAAVQDGLPKNPHAPYRDHLATVNVSSDFFAGCYFCLMLDTASKIAEIFGEHSDAQQYIAWLNDARKAFNERYYLKDEADYTPHCQGGLVLPLAFGIAPEKDRPALGRRLAEYVESDGYHPTTGYGATPHLLPLLCNFGYEKIAWKTFAQRGYPSWRHIFATGATSFTENWYGQNAKGFTDSMNHYALGSVCSWFFTHLGGIRPMESAEGFRRFKLKPVFVPEVGDFGVRYRCAYGEIRSDWHYDDDKILWSFTVPEGTTAMVQVTPNLPREYPAGQYQLIIEKDG